MKDWKKQEQQRIKQNKEDLERLRRKIDDRISGNSEIKLTNVSRSEKEKWSDKYNSQINMWSKYYRGATKKEFNRVKGRIK